MCGHTPRAFRQSSTQIVWLQALERVGVFLFVPVVLGQGADDWSCVRRCHHTSGRLGSQNTATPAQEDAANEQRYCSSRFHMHWPAPALTGSEPRSGSLDGALFDPHISTQYRFLRFFACCAMFLSVSHAPHNSR